jgi:hypothetical protein
MSKEMKIPSNLFECFQYLDNYLDGSDREWFKDADEKKAVADSFYGMGEWIRINWGLISRDGKLFEYFHKLGLSRSAEDISAVIATSYHRHLNNKELKLDEQIKKYTEPWIKKSK